jgi:DUF1680 family protein
MSVCSKLSRRAFVQTTSLAGAAAMTGHLGMASMLDVSGSLSPLQEFGYGDVALNSLLHQKQLRETHALLMDLNEDSLLKPLRQMSGQAAPGEDLGGWYHYDPHYDANAITTGFAPACTFGQWVSALARAYAINGDPATREKVLRLNRLYARTISADFYKNNRFPAYCYDKFVCGLMDAHLYAGDPDAYAILEHTTDTALPNLPGKAIAHGKQWRENPAEGYTWDESYTISENLFLAYQRGAGERYRTLGAQYLFDEFYNPLSEGHNVLAHHHAYSHVNSLCSAMQAYLTLGSVKHLRAASNAFDMLTAQSFATGGWGPGEELRAPESNEVADSLTTLHSSFETPCGSYAHFKLTRYLLRVTREARYGDSMERVMYNTVLGAKPLLADGSNFYYADCNFHGRKVYHDANWACCSGTLPQVAADYHLNSYFRDARGVYVNLFVPSVLRWKQAGAQLTLTQKSEYPFEGALSFEIAASQATEFSIWLRIPAWAQGATIAVNGKHAEMPAAGTFVEIRRNWKNGDRIEMELPMRVRLEPLDARHPDTVALLRGPLVLFALTDGAPKATRAQLLAATRAGAESWKVQTAGGMVETLPFTAIADQAYSTYWLAE